MTTPQSAKSNGFDKLARPYRWLEYLSFGPLLQQTRTTFLPETLAARHALVVGDGDGRFTAALLRTSRQVRVVAVDGSASMLRELQRRTGACADRLRTVHGDARPALCAMRLGASIAAPPKTFDLVCTHFFLDCLTDAECCDFVLEVSRQLQPGACWIVSEFAVPTGAMRWPAQALVRALYVAFGLLTGLRARRLPDYAGAMRAAGMQLVAQRTRLFGILRAEMWRDASPPRQTARGVAASNQP